MFRRSLIALTMLAGLLASPGVAAACQAPEYPTAYWAARADRIVLVRVAERIERSGRYDYALNVERVFKGGGLASTWALQGVGTSDCGMPPLARGALYVLEYWEPGGQGPSAWFFGWRVRSGGRVDAAAYHSSPPRTLAALVRLYDSLQLPMTSTHELPSTRTQRRDAPPVGLLALIFVISTLSLAMRSVRGRPPSG